MSSLYVEGFACVPARPAHEPPGSYDVSLLERSLRRGLSELIRLFMHSARHALTMAQRAPAEVHVVLASAFGELATAEAIMAQAFDDDSASPARFRHSVHNSAIGLLSISADNRLPGTALAAGRDTVPMGLLEAALQLADGAAHVLLVYAEEAVPRFLGSEADHGAAAAAFVLSAEHGARTRARLSVPRRTGPHLPMDGAAHPLAAALRMAELCGQNAAGRVVAGEATNPYLIEVEPLRNA